MSHAAIQISASVITASDVLFRNIEVLRSPNTEVVVIAENAASPISNVVFENVVIGGKRLVSDDTRLRTNAAVTGLLVR